MIKALKESVKLYEHQVKALDKTVNQKNTALLMEQGTGKTIVAIAAIGHIFNEGIKKALLMKIDKIAFKVLIIAPLAVLPVWQEELEKFAAYPFNATIIDGSTASKKAKQWSIDERPPYWVEVKIMNYESTWRQDEQIKKYAPSLVICDESQKIKTPTSKQSKYIHKLGDRAKYKMILTGTPVTNAPLDFWSQYRFLNPDILGTSFVNFKARYAQEIKIDLATPVGQRQKFFKKIVGYKHLDELTRKVHSISYRVTKDEALDLPERIYQKRYVELEPEALRVYKQLLQDGITAIEQESGERGHVVASTVLTRLLRLSQATGGFAKDDEDVVHQISKAKLNELESIIDDTCVDAGKKIVVFARFLDEIHAIEAMCNRKFGQDQGHRAIYGAIKDRGGAVADFQTNDAIKVFIAQEATAGAGITLHAASTAVFYSISYSYANYEQCKARIHRIGQKNKCLYINLLAKGTIDQKILGILEDKGEVANAVVDHWREIYFGGNK